MKSSPTAPVSVCIPVKDRLGSLQLALASVYSQTVLPREVIIVDDASSCPVTLAELPRSPTTIRVEIVRNQVNIGGAQSRNRAVAAATQPLIAFLDSDDLFLPTYVESIAQEWSHDGSFSALACDFYWCTDEMVPYRRQHSSRTVERYELLRDGNTVGGCSVLSVKRSSFLAAGGFVPARGVDDWQLLINLSRQAPILVIPTPLVLYKAPELSSGESMTRRHGRQILALTALLKGLSQADAKLSRHLIALLVSKHLAAAGKRRSALYLLIRSLKGGGKLKRLHLQVAVSIVMGDKRLRILLSWMARRKAQRPDNYLVSEGLSCQQFVEKLRKIVSGLEKPQTPMH